MTAYYNEIDPYAAEWLRNLIKAGHIADGVVDTRSISEIEPYDLRDFTQCHFFAGIGVWSLALRLAGWPDDRPVWTGSCPCQPFSSAGQSAGFADERHLWPQFHHLIRECQPAIVFGEQVASKAIDPWIDLVHADLEALGYAFAGIPFPSAGVGAPHIRDRLFWLGYAHHQGLEGHARDGGAAGWRRAPRSVAEASVLGGVADAEGRGLGISRGEVEQEDVRHIDGSGDALGGLADAQGQRERTDEPRSDRLHREQLARAEPRGHCCHYGADAQGRAAAGPTNGFWRDADWLSCRDGKWRPVEPGTFPLAHGAAARVGRLRAYGNAINAQAAAEFIGAFLDHEAVGGLV